MGERIEKITLGGGCYWCLEAIFQRLDAVRTVQSGYAGGKTEHPTYRDVCSGVTGHAEVVQLEYSADEISLAQILEVFWEIHDPTTLNRQGNDVGTQYRSAIYYNTEEELAVIKKSVQELQESGKYEDAIVTEIKKLDQFYPAEEEHRNYYDRHPENRYCQIVIDPKVKKFLQNK